MDQTITFYKRIEKSHYIKIQGKKIEKLVENSGTTRYFRVIKNAGKEIYITFSHDGNYEVKQTKGTYYIAVTRIPNGIYAVTIDYEKNTISIIFVEGIPTIKTVIGRLIVRGKEVFLDKDKRKIVVTKAQNDAENKTYKIELGKHLLAKYIVREAKDRIEYYKLS